MAAGIEPFYKELGRRIQQARQQRGLSQERLGRLLRPATTRASIGNIEAGKQRVLVHTLVQIATVLEAGIDDLLFDHHPPTPVSSQAESTVIKLELAQKLNMLPSEIRKLAQQMKANIARKGNER